MLKLALTSLVLLALKGGYAQITPDTSREETLPVIPIFDVRYDPSMVIASASGEVTWMSRYYKKDGDYIGEIKGEANIEASLWPFNTNVYVGFITRINYTKNTIETITYNNGSDYDGTDREGEEKVLSEFERRIARRESIDTLLANDVSIEFSDYTLGTLKDLENNNVINSDSYGLQESYFSVKRKLNGTTGRFEQTFKVHIKGKEYDIPAKDSVDNRGKPFLFVDLQVNDPKKLGEKINILEQINWLKIYDNGTVPYKVIAEVNVDLKITSITKEITLTLKE